MATQTEYELSDKVFAKICLTFGQPSIDLFATRLNSKWVRYVSWHKDPDSLYVDAFTKNWENEFLYAFPPFCIITKVIHKIIQDKAEGILILPLWKNQSWFSILLQILIKPPLIIGPSKHLILSPFREPHTFWKKLSLVAASVSGERSFKEDYQKEEWKLYFTP